MNYAVLSKTSSRNRSWDVTLAEMFTVTALLYTLTDRKPSRGVGNM